MTERTKMTTPRKLQIDLNATPYYHCINRCVRGQYLFGYDPTTGIDYSYRKEWIEERLRSLCQAFAIKLCNGTVMSNHYHLVLFVDEAASKTWTYEEVFKRWKLVFPKNADDFESEVYQPLSEIGQEKLQLWRERLATISWFMKALNQYIAIKVNEEDGIHGRFWDTRFKSVPLLDEGALLTAMAYVDLNPIRANIALTPENSDHTSFKERYEYCQKHLNVSKYDDKDLAARIDAMPQPPHLVPFANGQEKDYQKRNEPCLPFSLSEYFRLVDQTGKVIRKDKRGSIPSDVAPILQRINLKPKHWLGLIENFEQSFLTAVGAEIYLVDFGRRRQRAVKALTSAKRYYQSG